MNLTFSTSPLTIPRLVIPVVFLTVKGLSNGTRTEFGEELFKASIKKLDSSTSVIFPMGVVRICAAIFGGNVRAVRAGLLPRFSLTMFNGVVILDKTNGLSLDVVPL